MTEFYLGTLAGGLGCFPLDREAYPRGLTPGVRIMVFGVWFGLVSRWGPLADPVLYPRGYSFNALPK